MKRLPSFTRVVWAVDPFAEDRDLQQLAASTLDALVGGHVIQVEPVSVIHQPSPGDKIPRDEAAALAALRKMIATFGPKNALAPVVITQDEMALTEAVKKLIGHASETGAHLIVVGTDAMKGSTGFLLGSFAEAVILQSDIPTLAVSPRTRATTKITEIVFPTDLTERSLAAFPQVLVTAKQLGAQVLIFHRIETKNDVAPNHGLSSTPEELPEQVLKSRMKEMQALALQSKAEGLATEVKIQSLGAGSADAIVELSKGSNRMIAMVSQTKAPETRRLGEVTRTVLRHAFCPLWIIHPKCSSQTGKETL